MVCGRAQAFDQPFGLIIVQPRHKNTRPLCHFSNAESRMAHIRKTRR
jgi:hypothetical protein